METKYLALGGLSLTPSPIGIGRERLFLLLLGALVAFGPMAIDLYLPALPAIAVGLGASVKFRGPSRYSWRASHWECCFTAPSPINTDSVSSR